MRPPKLLGILLIGAASCAIALAGQDPGRLSPDAEATANCMLVGITLEGYYVDLLDGKSSEVEAQLARNRSLTAETAREAADVLKSEIATAKPTTLGDVKAMAAGKFAACLDRKGVGIAARRSYCYTYAELVRTAYKRRGVGVERAAETLPPDNAGGVARDCGESDQDERRAA